MSSTTGPNLVKNGIVACYDAGSIKSFKGEPTTNYIPSTYDYNYYAYVNGVPTATNNVLNENSFPVTVQRYTVSNAVNVARAAIRPTGLSTGTYYSLSYKWKYNGTTTTTPSFDSNASKGNPEGGANNNTMASSVQTHSYIGNGWYYSTHVFSFSSCPTSACILTFGLVTGTAAGYINETFDIYEAQFEIKDHPTPYANGSRGATVATGGGWKDLFNNYNGELVNNILYNGNNGGSLTFNGSDTRIVATDIDFSISFTLEAWINVTAFGGYRTIIKKNTENDQWPVMSMYLNPNGGLIGDYSSAVYGQCYESATSADSLISISNWYYVAFSKGDAGYTSMKLYINGQSISYTAYNYGSHVNTLANSTKPFHIGANLDGSNWINIFNGRIANVKIYNKQLSDLEILQNFNALRGRFGV